jgi:hypothetical protein
MLEEVLRLMAEVGPGAVWIGGLLTAVVATFVLYIGIALWAVLRAKDPKQRKIRYRIFRDLIGLFDRRRRG